MIKNYKKIIKIIQLKNYLTNFKICKNL